MATSFLVVVGVVFIIFYYIIVIIGYWKNLKKAGKSGWTALIPIIGNILALIVSIYFVVLLNVSLARSFNKPDSYAIDLILLPVVFYLMLGIGSTIYVG